MKTKFLAAFMMLFSQFAYPCGPSDTLHVYLGKGVGTIEKIKVILDSADDNTEKTIVISDDDGLANLFLMTSLTKGMDEKNIQAQQVTFLNSLAKAITYNKGVVQKRIQRLEGNSLDPFKRMDLQSNIRNIQTVIAEMEALSSLVRKDGLTRKNFGSLIHKIINVITPSYEAGIFEDGELKMFEKAYGLRTILGESVYDSIANITVNGEYFTTRGGCGVRSVLAVDTIKNF